MKKRLLALLLILALFLTLAPMAGAIPITEDPTEVASGPCGDNLTWVLMSDGALTISGTGRMWDWSLPVIYLSPPSYAPWIDYLSSIKTVTIESGVTTISDYSFYNCDSLTSIDIPDSVTTIGDYAFFYCTKLTSITIPNSVTTIGNWAFDVCHSLTSVTMGNSVTTIGYDAFCECTNLTSVTMGNSVTTIGSEAFYNCDSLTSIDIPDSVTTIGSGAFGSCDKLTYNVYDNAKYLGNDSNPYLYLAEAMDTSVQSCVVHPNTRLIGWDAFGSCDKLTSITIPNSVTTIGGWAFGHCSGLTSVTIPDSVTTIGDSAFCSCDRLTDVYYNGTQTQWEKIDIGSNNEELLSATLHTLPEPQLTDYSLNLDSAIRLNFYVSEVPGFTSYIDMDGTRYDKVDDFYPTREFHAKEMADSVKATLKYEYDSKTTESTSFTTSIQKYAEAVLGEVEKQGWTSENGDYGAKSGRLMVAMLNYGTEAQKYFGYNTENPANANISQYQKYLTDTPTCADHRTGNDNPLYYGTACVLGANMNMKFYLKLKTAEGREGWNYRISYTNYLGKEVEKDLTFAQLTDSNNGFYSYTLTELVAADIDTPVTLKVLDGDTEKLAVTDSISSYLARIMVSNPDCADVANAMLLFGAKAYDYFEGSVTPPALDEDELPLN